MIGFEILFFFRYSCYMKERFLHIDMDAFYASVEQLDNPKLRGRPIVVGGSSPNSRGVVSAASYEARKFGVHSAMPLAQVRRLCPDAVFVPVRMGRYVEVSKQVFNIFYNYTPMIEKLSVDEAFLEVSGVQKLFGSPVDIALKIKNDIKQNIGITCSAGVANRKYLAKIASDMNKPDGLTVVPEDVIGFLRPLPVSALWGVGRVTGEALRVRGIHKVGDIQDIPEHVLNNAVGKNLADHLKNLAFGRDYRTVETEHVEKSISNELTYAKDLYDRNEILNCLYKLANKVGGRLRASGMYAMSAQVKIKWSDFKSISRQKTFDIPICDDFTLRRAATELLDKVELKRGVRLVGFGVSKLTEKKESSQMSLFVSDDLLEIEKREKLSKVVDQVRKKFGEESI